MLSSNKDVCIKSNKRKIQEEDMREFLTNLSD